MPLGPTCAMLLTLFLPPAPPGGEEPLPASRVHVDPETGRFIVPAEKNLAEFLSPEIREGLRTTSEDLEEVVRPDGSASVHLGGRFLSVLSAEAGPGGEDLRLRHGPPAPRKEAGDDREP